MPLCYNGHEPLLSLFNDLVTSHPDSYSLDYDIILRDSIVLNDCDCDFVKLFVKDIFIPFPIFEEFQA